MRLANSAHTSRPWRIHELASDFRLEDVWKIPVTGGADDFHAVVQRLATLDPANSSSPIVRALFTARWKIGALLGWDDPEDGLGARVPDRAGRFGAQMAVYVKPNGLLGEAYMAAIKPLRYLLVYPPMLGEVSHLPAH